MVYGPIGYTTEVIKYEPVKTFYNLQRNPIMWVIVVVTVILTAIFVIRGDFYG